MSANIYSHFLPEEHRFVDKVMDWLERAERQHDLIRSDFLDPRQAFIVTSLAGRSGNIGVRLDGGYPQSERQRALIAPDYRMLDLEEINIVVLAVHSADHQIDKLDHGDYMGAILGLGIKRDKLGDIHVFDWGCHCLIASEMAEFIDLQLRQVHRVQVQTEILPLHQLQTTSVELQELQLSVASLRLDGIASDVYRLSRAKMLEPIRAGRCRVNWKMIDNPAKLLQQGDIVSFKGFGRFKMLEIGGQTRGGRMKVTVGKYV